MKKRISLILSGVLLIGCMGLSGCKEKKEVNKDEIVTLSWLLPGDQQPDMASVAEKINEITAWIKQVRHDLKVNVVKKQNREINTRQMYSYMHDVFGPQATNLFDLQNTDIDLSYQSTKPEEEKK